MKSDIEYLLDISISDVIHNMTNKTLQELRDNRIAKLMEDTKRDKKAKRNKKSKRNKKGERK